jgi:hypothetical protein
MRSGHEDFPSIEAAFAVPVGEVQTPPKRYRRDRKCPMCATVLVSFNPGPFCYLHTPREGIDHNRVPTRRRKEPTP